MKLQAKLRAVTLAAFLGMSLGAHQSSSAYVLPVVEVGPNVWANIATEYEQAINTAQAYISAYNDVLQTWNEISTFDVASVFLTTDEKNALMSFISTGKNVYGAVRKTQDVYTQLQTAFATSPFQRFEDFLKDFSRRNAHGEQMAKTLYDAAVVAEDELKKAHEQHTRVVNEMPNIHGVTEAAKATAQSVGVLIQQNQGVVQLLSAQVRAQGQELQRQYQEQAQDEEAKLKILELQREAFRKDMGLMGGR
ncbi:hypothetical protein [Hydrogenophaga sp. NFH-34]|uniref:hypothetical protein n=1 Tax=Hydrogenophaga sp. NFH-34 TaxID=2744446 RepID=UPI001F31571B|nr:hypothetical protein [Hydrogenophaga sp. NFH-34]